MGGGEERSWLEIVADTFLQYNRDWVPLLFESHGTVDVVRVPDDEGGGFRYVFENCRLRVLPDGDPKVCGDVGGKTTKGAACRKRGRKNGDGRCAIHPYKKVVVRVDHYGKTCDQIRPIAAPLPWSAFGVEADGMAVTAAPPDFGSPKRFVSAEHVWSELVLGVCRDVGLKPNATFVFPDGKEMGAEPLWPSSFLLEMFPKGTTVRVDGATVQPGYTVQDYGVQAGSRVNIEVIYPRVQISPANLRRTPSKPRLPSG